MIVNQKLIECVPNFSEGKDKVKIKQIVNAGRVIGATILEIESDPDHNRMLVTIVGEPEVVFKSAWRMIEKATELIDMTTHYGEHPRIGATDVVPFVPVANVGMDECVELARRLGKKVAEELAIPVYLYEAAATRPERVNLADVRRGEYEGLKEAIRYDQDRQPDFGPNQMHPTAGACVIGARKFLVAYNVNLASTDLKVAREMAALVREKSGGFPAVKALGMEIKNKGFVQVSMNLCDFEKTNMDVVFEKISQEAQKRGVEVIGSEIYGMVPKAALKGIDLSKLKLIDFNQSQILENNL